MGPQRRESRLKRNGIPHKRILDVEKLPQRPNGRRVRSEHRQRLRCAGPGIFTPPGFIWRVINAICTLFGVPFLLSHSWQSSATLPPSAVPPNTPASGRAAPAAGTAAAISEGRKGRQYRRMQQNRAHERGVVGLESSHQPSWAAHGGTPTWPRAARRGEPVIAEV